MFDTMEQGKQEGALNPKDNQSGIEVEKESGVW